MKKLVIAALAAIMTAGSYAAVCDEVETTPVCRAWDIKVNVKTLCTKKTICKSDCNCGDSTQEYYLEDCTRQLKGYLWVCEYECGKKYNICLWDPKNKVAIIPVTTEAVDLEAYCYGKKATKVTGELALESDNIEMLLTGIRGVMTRDGSEGGCYVKNLSGTCAGKIAYIKPSTGTEYLRAKGNLCNPGEETIIEAKTWDAKILPLCDACLFEGWCTNGETAEDLVPASGTWSLKYNKSVSKGTKTISQLVPEYAL